MPRTHYLSGEDVHYKWDVSNEPLIVIDPADTVVVWTRDISDSQASPDADASVLANFDWDRAYPLSGPIGIHGAQPGDTLRVDVLDVHTQGWGGTAPAARRSRSICSAARVLLPTQTPARLVDVYHAGLASGQQASAANPYSLERAPGARQKLARNSREPNLTAYEPRGLGLDVRRPSVP
jgi:Acetamidase/Formamidase family